MVYAITSELSNICTVTLKSDEIPSFYFHAKLIYQFIYEAAHENEHCHA